MNTERLRRVLGLARQLFSLLAIATIACYLWLHRAQLDALIHAARPAPILFAGILFAALHFVIATAFWLVQRAVGIERPLRRALDSYLLRLPARYIPGGVWHTLSRYVDIHDERRAGKHKLLLVFVIENGLVGSAGLGLAAAALLVFPVAAHAAPYALALALLGGVVAAALAYTARVTHAVSARRALAAAFGLLSINWVGVATAFGLFFFAVAPALTDCAAQIPGSAYLVSSSLGFVAVFAPQGWGVAEFVLALLHPCSVDAPTAVAALTGFRLLGALADALLFALWRALAAWRGGISAAN